MRYPRGMSLPITIIDAQRAKVAQKQEIADAAVAEVERERLILLGMERMHAAFTPPRSAAADALVTRAPKGQSSGPGRQRGAISHEWRGVLAALVGPAFTEADFHYHAQATVGRDIRVGDAKRRREAYLENGLIESAEDGFRYRVTDYAINKFGLNSAEVNNGAGTPTTETPAPLSVHPNQEGGEGYGPATT